MRQKPGTVRWVLPILAACTRPIPDFNFSFSSPGGEVKQGEIIEIPLTITRSGGFNKKITVALDSPPSGISASPAVVQPEGNQISLFVEVDKAIPPSDGFKLAIKVAGEGLANPKVKEYSLKVLQAFDLSLNVVPTSLSFNQGSNAPIKVDVERSPGFSEGVAISVSGLPPGVSVAPASIPPGTGAGSVNLSFVAGADAQVVKDQEVTISASGQGIGKTATLKLTVIEPFKLEVSEAALTIGQGGSKEITISAIRDGFSGAIPLTLTGLPAKVTVSPTSLNIPEGQDSTKAILSIDPTASVAANQTITVSGTALGLTKSKTFGLNIEAVAPDFDFTLAPSPLNLNQGGSAGLNVSVTRNPTLIGEISVTAAPTGMPVGVTAEALTIPAGQAQGSLTFTASINAEVVSEREISVSVSAQGLSKTKTFKLNVLVITGYSIALNPSDLIIEKPASGTKSGASQINLTRTLYTDAVNLSVLGLPTGVSASFSPDNLSGATLNSTLTLSVNPSATARNETYPLIVRATGSGGRQVDQTLTLKIADLSLTATDLTAVRAETTALNFNLNKTGFVGDVQVAITGLPAGVTVTSPVTVSASSGSFALSVAKDAAIPPAPVTLTLTATVPAIPGLSRSTTLKLTLKPQFEMVLHQGTSNGPVVNAVSIQQGDNNFPGNLIWVEVKRNGSYNKAVYLRALTDGAVLEVGQTAGSGQGFFPTLVPGNAPSSFRFAAKPTAAVGTYNFFVEAVQVESSGNPPVLDEGVRARAELSVAITTPFSISLGSSTGSINQGGTTDLTVNVVRNAPFSGPINVTASGLPAGITANPLTIGASSSSGVLTLVASNSATLGGVPVTISGGATLGIQYTQTVLKTAPFNLTVDPKPAVDFSFDPPSLTLNPTTTVSDSKVVTIALIRTNFSDAVTIFIEPTSIPGGLTYDANPKVIPAGANSVSFTLTAAGGMSSLGPFNVKFSAIGSGIAEVTKDLPVTVVAGP